MAAGRWYRKRQEAAEKNKNTIAYVVLGLALVGSLVGLGLLPDVVSVSPEAEGLIARPKEHMVAFHFGLVALFTGLFWRRPRELVYLGCALFGLIMMYLMLYANLGI